MFTKFLGIAGNSLTETIRQPIYGILLLVTVFLLILNLSLAGYTFDDDNKLLKDLSLSTLLLCGLFLAAFSAAGVLSREIENKTVLTVVSKPVGRPVFILGKFTGLTGALVIAYYLCGIVFLLTMRHKVMSTSADQYDKPVIIFGLAAFFGTLLISALCNYLYDMQFSSTSVTLSVPLMTVALVLVCMIDPNWQIQQFGKDFIDGQIIGAITLVFAMVLIATAVAVAVSTRFGQVATLGICTLVLMIGLASDNLFGQAQKDHILARIAYWLSPNLAFLWVTDALTQENHITAQYVGMAFGYAMFIVASWLLIAIALFQKREVG